MTRLDAVVEAFTLAWLEGAAAREGNPRGLTVWREGSVVAPASPAAPNLDFFNRVFGLRADERHHVRALVAWYRHQGIWPWFEVSPEPELPALLDALAAEGAWPVGAHTVLVAETASVIGRARADLGARPAGMALRPVSAEEIEPFGRTLMVGHDVPTDGLDDAVADLAHWPAVPGLHLVQADLEGQPIGAAALLVRDGIGYLANAAVVPASRSQGAHRALIAWRINLAAEHGCEHVSAIVGSFGGPSHRNLQRAGLRNAHGRISLRLGG